MGWATLWAILGVYWAILGVHWAILGVYWAILGVYSAILGVYWAILGVYWAILGVYSAILGVYWAILGVYWAIFHKKHPITLAVIETLHGNTNRKISTWRKLGAKLFLFNKLQLPPTVLREMADFLLLVKLFPGNGNTHTHTGFVSFRCV
jgi:hypothetical protein